MTTIDDVLAEFQSYYQHTLPPVPGVEDTSFSGRARRAFEDLREGNAEEAKAILAEWIERGKNELCVDHVPLEALPEEKITLEQVQAATQEDPERGKRLNVIRLQQLLCVLS